MNCCHVGDCFKNNKQVLLRGKIAVTLQFYHELLRPEIQAQRQSVSGVTTGIPQAK